MHLDGLNDFLFTLFLCPIIDLDYMFRRTVKTLSHVNAKGQAQMVDISLKQESSRTAKASARVYLGKEAFLQVAANTIKKGDVLGVAKIAGITAAKNTGFTIPLCHPLLLSQISVEMELVEESHAVLISSQVSCIGKTGVEIEALHAVSVAALTVYDMCKAVSKSIKISDIQLEEKTGGKSKDYKRSL